MLLNVLAQAAQGSEDLAVELVVGAQLHAVGLRDRQGDFQNVDRIQPQAFPVQRRGRIDFRGLHLQIERGDDQLGQLELFGGEGVVRQSLFHRGLVPNPCVPPQAIALIAPGFGRPSAQVELENPPSIAITSPVTKRFDWTSDIMVSATSSAVTQRLRGVAFARLPIKSSYWSFSMRRIQSPSIQPGATALTRMSGPRL